MIRMFKWQHPPYLLPKIILFPGFPRPPFSGPVFPNRYSDWEPTQKKDGNTKLGLTVKYSTRVRAQIFYKPRRVNDEMHFSIGLSACSAT
jgi:hypothetical protein